MLDQAVILVPPEPTPEALDERSLGQRAYEAIFQAIQNGRLPPGSRVREADLTAWLGMSRTPLRAGLQRLQTEGLLRLESHRGVLISRLDRRQITELYTAREWAEGAAAALAAQSATAAEIDGLRHLLALERAAAGDPEEGARLNRLVHEAIRDSTGNQYLIDHLRALSALLGLVGNATRRDAVRVQEAGREHEALVDAIAARDAGGAEAQARAHIRNAQLLVLSNHAMQQDGRIS
ncbi:MAG: GntR family transcriptional regulator [Acetobacteraceae bacterium]|nr:GntR family transcriptional regulator [Acetobacteraceae bacterium]